MLSEIALVARPNAASNPAGCHSGLRSFTLDPRSDTWATSCFVLVFKEAKFANSV